MDYELTYKKVHNTLKSMKAPNKYGDVIGKKVENLIAPTLEGYDNLQDTKTVGELKTEIEAAVENTNNDNYTFQYLAALGTQMYDNNDNVIKLSFGTGDTAQTINEDFYLPGYNYEPIDETALNSNIMAVPTHIHRKK